MKYIIFSIALAWGFTTISNAQNETAKPDVNDDRYNLKKRPLPVPMVKGRHEPTAKTMVQRNTPMCFEKGAYTFLTDGQSCMITNNEEVQTKLTKVTMIRDGKYISGWKIDSNKYSKIKDYTWLDYSADSFAKSLADSRIACNKKGAVLPSYEELSAAADSGFLRILRETEFRQETDAQIKNIRIRSNSIDETRQKSLSRKLDYSEKDKDGPLAKPAITSKGDTIATGYDISLCVIRPN